MEWAMLNIYCKKKKMKEIIEKTSDYNQINRITTYLIRQLKLFGIVKYFSINNQ
ncbi:MAG: hypothetical protein Q7U35_05485 [Methanobacteriaceae archaeon]|nr:hypothetical protein [Methanobacteriaceae archaeon]